MGSDPAFGRGVPKKPIARWEVAEACLAHSTGGKVERSYKRTDFLEQRRVLMQYWADFVSAD